MEIIKRFTGHYQKGYMPWSHKNPDFNLVRIIGKWPVKPGKMLEMGCGTGVDAVWLAEQGFEVTACDVSEIAIQMAKENLSDRTGRCRFHVLDCLNDPIPGTPFAFIYDRGYFHSYKTKKLRKKLAEKIADSLQPSGLWFSISGSCDGEERQDGPPRLQAKDLIEEVEEYFEILMLKASHFESDEEKPSRAWACLMRKRSK